MAGFNGEILSHDPYGMDEVFLAYLIPLCYGVTYPYGLSQCFSSDRFLERKRDGIPSCFEAIGECVFKSNCHCAMEDVYLEGCCFGCANERV